MKKVKGLDKESGLPVSVRIENHHGELISSIRDNTIGGPNSSKYHRMELI